MKHDRGKKSILLGLSIKTLLKNDLTKERRLAGVISAKFTSKKLYMSNTFAQKLTDKNCEYTRPKNT